MIKRRNKWRDERCKNEYLDEGLSQNSNDEQIK